MDLLAQQPTDESTRLTTAQETQALKMPRLGVPGSMQGLSGSTRELWRKRMSWTGREEKQTKKNPPTIKVGNIPKKKIVAALRGQSSKEAVPPKVGGVGGTN